MSHGLSNTVMPLIVKLGAISRTDGYIPQIVPNDVLCGIDGLKKRPLALRAPNNGQDGHSEKRKPHFERQSYGSHHMD
jgi:hypothetical protein